MVHDGIRGFVLQMKINTFTFRGSIDKNKLIDPSYQVEGNKKQGGEGIRLTEIREE